MACTARGRTRQLRQMPAPTPSAGMKPQPRPPLRLLIVDDDDDLRFVLVKAFEHGGAAVTACGSAEDALARSERTRHDVALVDLHLPGMDGIALLDRLKAMQPEMEVLVFTADSSVETAVQAMKHG